MRSLVFLNQPCYIKCDSRRKHARMADYRLVPAALMELLASALIGSGWLRGLSFNQVRQKAVEFDLLHCLQRLDCRG